MNKYEKWYNALIDRAKKKEHGLKKQRRVM